jgi:predicted trehalose synthase
MAKFWAKRIKYDLSRIDEVPDLWREQVRELIEER